MDGFLEKSKKKSYQWFKDGPGPLGNILPLISHPGDNLAHPQVKPNDHSVINKAILSGIVFFKGLLHFADKLIFGYTLGINISLIIAF
jgi:hypothetical protein